MKITTKIFSLILVYVGIVTSYNSAKATSVSIREVSTIQAQNSVDLKVWSGYGLTISFSKTGEKITQAWLGDPSRIAFTTNGSLCPKTSTPSGCKNAGATVVFLRQIKPLNFAGLTNSDDGGTQLVILTNGGDGQKQYQFRVVPAKGSPQYTSVVLSSPDVPMSNVVSGQNSLPAPMPSMSTISINPVRPGLLPKTHRDNANALVAGLMVAKIEPNSLFWNQAQLAIKLLRQGKNINEVSRVSGISVLQLSQLIKMGQN